MSGGRGTFDVRGEVILVTGATKGIGLSITEKLLTSGASKVYGVGRDKVAIEALELKWAGRFVPLKFDLADTQHIESTIRSNCPDVTMLVNNAGTIIEGNVLEAKLEDITRMYNVNCIAPLMILKAVAQLIIDREGQGTGRHIGSIVNISSIRSTQPAGSDIGYSSTKGAVDAMTRSAAISLGPYGINVNSVNPGLVRTKLAESHYPKEIFEFCTSKTPLQKLSKPEDIADVVLFFLSGSSSMVTGTCLAVDGGQTAGVKSI